MSKTTCLISLAAVFSTAAMAQTFSGKPVLLQVKAAKRRAMAVGTEAAGSTPEQPGVLHKREFDKRGTAVRAMGGAG